MIRYLLHTLLEIAVLSLLLFTLAILIAPDSTAPSTRGQVSKPYKEPLR